jgi:predicted DNA-binding protein
MTRSMTRQSRRICVSLPPEQVRGLKNVSRMLNQSVSGLVSELIGEAVLNFEQLVINRDIEGAKQRLDELHREGHTVIQEVENVSHQ